MSKNRTSFLTEEHRSCVIKDPAQLLPIWREDRDRRILIVSSSLSVPCTNTLTMRLHPLLIASAVCILGQVTAFPFPDHQHTSRQSVNCTDLQASTDSSCWQGLQLTNWLTNWNTTTPVCGPNEDDADCCQSTEPWTTCFLRLARNNGDCSQINIQTCSWNSLLQVSSDIAPEVFYIIKNIYCTYENDS